MEFTRERLIEEGGEFFRLAASSKNLEVVRERLFRRVTRFQFDVFDEDHEPSIKSIVRVRDCARALRSILRPQSDRLAGFSVAGALFDIAQGKDRRDLEPGFYAEMIHMLMGLQGRGPGMAPVDFTGTVSVSGRKAALIRTDQLDEVWKNVEDWMAGYTHGLETSAIQRRKKRKKQICTTLQAADKQWNDWRWQLKNVVKSLTMLERLVPLTAVEREGIDAALRAKLPFGITPYYLSLMDDDGESRDMAIRAQVFPSTAYVQAVAPIRSARECAFDFMLEKDTSPIDLVTRRYPAIAILKPYNTCPQICVYCQRNWEIETAMAPGALAPSRKIDKALEWISEHPAIHEVLITGGDPLALNDATIDRILGKVAAIDTVEHIRIGSRIPVTVPMRITDTLINIIKKHINLGKRDIALVTHVEHPYEVTPELARAVHKFRKAGISVYNQQVFTFYVSRRFESALLRRILRKIGIEPYYIFNTKGKSETSDFIVPIARLIQEVSEEARLLPGLTRTDEPVYNVPGLGKNYLRARQHRDLVAILPNGARVYEFHPWDRNITEQKNYVGIDVPILSYLQRLELLGEDISQYETIWYYY
jgi:lysine 2,3-aminomutase